MVIENVRRGIEEAIPDTSADGALATNGDDRERVPGHERVSERQGILDREQGDDRVGGCLSAGNTDSLD